MRWVTSRMPFKEWGWWSLVGLHRWGRPYPVQVQFRRERLFGGRFHWDGRSVQEMHLYSQFHRSERTRLPGHPLSDGRALQLRADFYRRQVLPHRLALLWVGSHSNRGLNFLSGSFGWLPTLAGMDDGVPVAEQVIPIVPVEEQPMPIVPVEDDLVPVTEEANIDSQPPGIHSRPMKTLRSLIWTSRYSFSSCIRNSQSISAQSLPLHLVVQSIPDQRWFRAEKRPGKCTTLVVWNRWGLEGARASLTSFTSTPIRTPASNSPSPAAEWVGSASQRRTYHYRFEHDA